VLLSDGPVIANDGGFGHAGTGVTFTFQAHTFPTSHPESCGLWTYSRLTWEISAWP
jgi:hypothetical protein